MGTTSEKLTYLNGTKQLLKDKINNLGGSIDDNTTFRQYANQLQNVYDNLPKTEYQEGTEVNLGVTSKGKLDYENGVVGIGQTEQDSTQGYQLINPNKHLQIYSNVSIGSIGTLNAGSSPCWTTWIEMEEGETYIFSGDLSEVNSNVIRAFVTNDEVKAGVSALRVASMTANNSSNKYTNSSNYKYLILEFLNLTEYNNTWQLEKGTTAHEWEQYTGGQASPNPSYKQEVETTTGEQEVVVRGKNIFDISAITEGKGIRSSDGAIINLPSFNLSDYCNVNGNTTYCLSWVSDSAYFQVIYACYDSTKTLVSYGNLTTSGVYYSKTITTPSNAKYLRFSYSIVVQSEPVTREYIQLETGTERTTYEPYITPTSYQLSLGDKELYDECYIVGSPDNWKYVDNMYKTKLKDIQLYGDWSLTQRNNLYYFWFLYESMYDIPKGRMLDSDGNLAPILSNYFGSRNVFYSENTEKNVIVKNTQPTSPMFIVAVDSEIASSVAEWKNYIANHEDLYVVYSTKEPLETPITDETLISQLNAWYNAHSLNGTTIITSNGNLPMIIKVRGLKGE